MEEKKRAHVIITGKVQGVFFRIKTQRAAEKYGVFGWVRNRRDGSVEALFEGNQKQVDAVIKWCYRGAPHSVVTHVDVKWRPYTGEFRRFEITY